MFGTGALVQCINVFYTRREGITVVGEKIVSVHACSCIHHRPTKRSIHLHIYFGLHIALVGGFGVHFHGLLFIVAHKPVVRAQQTLGVMVPIQFFVGR